MKEIPLIDDMPLTLATPEDWGAVGDGRVDDWESLNAFFNHWHPASLHNSVALALSPGKVYAYSRPLVVTTGATKPDGSLAYFRLVLQGNGASLRYTGGAGKGYAFGFGDYGIAKGNRCSMYDVHFSASNGADGILLVDHADFSNFTNVSAQGRANEACIKVNQGNSITFNQMFATGGDIGVLVGPNRTANVFHLSDGRILQCRKGVVLSSTKFRLENLDISWCQDAVECYGCQYGLLDVYSEQNGPGPLIRLANCRAIEVAGMLNASDKADVCVDVADSSDVIVTGHGYMPASREFIRQTNSQNVIQAPQATCEMVARRVSP